MATKGNTPSIALVAGAAPSQRPPIVPHPWHVPLSLSMVARARTVLLWLAMVSMVVDIWVVKVEAAVDVVVTMAGAKVVAMMEATRSGLLPTIPSPAPPFICG